MITGEKVKRTGEEPNEDVLRSNRRGEINYDCCLPSKACWIVHVLSETAYCNFIEVENLSNLKTGGSHIEASNVMIVYRGNFDRHTRV